MEVPTEDITTNFADLPQGPLLKEMVDTGVFFGRKKSKTNPKMKPFIFGNRGGVEIIDLNKTLEEIERAQGFLREKASAGGLFLFVATQPPAVDVVSLARELGAPVVEKRWIGGTLTNFNTIYKRIEYFQKTKNDLATGALDKYTKKERLTLEKETKRLDEMIGGLVSLVKLPDALIMVNPILHESAVREARRLGIPIVALANTDSDPDLIDYLVPGNTSARKSIQWFFEKVKGAIQEGRKSVPPPVAAEKSNEPENGRS